MSMDEDLAEVIGAAPEKPRLSLVETVRLPDQMEPYRALLEQALEGTFQTLEDVARAIAMQQAQIWPGKKSVMVTEIMTAPSAKYIRVWLGAGDMDELLAMSAGVESWARINGCQYATIEGRKGWEKALKDKGYEPWFYTVKKAL